MAKPLALNISSTWQNTLDRSVNIGVKLVAFLVILLIGWFIARLLGKLVDRLLDRIKFNAAADRSGLSRWTGRYTAGGLVGKLIYYGILLFTLELAFNVFGANPVSELLSGVVRWLPKLFVACVIIVVAAAVAKAVYDVVGSALGQLSYGPALARTVQVLIVALGAIAALNQIGVATTVTMPVLITALATVGGILVVGLGGGLIAPMRERWERMLGHAEREGTKVAGSLRQPGHQDPGSAFGQPAYQARTGQAAQDVHREPAGAEPGPADMEPAHHAAQGTGYGAADIRPPAPM
jgi:hypothetical protein